MAEVPIDRLSLVVGVTGHRDVAAADEPALRDAFATVLAELRRACPRTPMLVLSGLAAGADSLAAEEAIARGIPVFACLPMPVEEYEKDFSPDELVRFRTLLAASARVVVTSPSREHGYVAVGRFITQYSHLVVAFWDGTSSRGAGGTADVIHMRLTGEVLSSSIDAVPYLPDIGPVVQIVTPRASEPRPNEAFAIRRRYPRLFLREDDARHTYWQMLAEMDAYNADLAQVPAPPETTGIDAIMRRTDAAANRLQTQTNRFQIMLLACALAVATVQIIVHFPSIWKVIGLLVAFLVYEWARRHNYENRYQDYRAIAEGLRVQSAWYCAGLQHKLVDNEYLKMQEGELQWIRMALRFFYLLFCEERSDPNASAMHPVCTDWVRSQWRYYYRASRRETLRKRTMDRVALGAMAAGILCTLVSLVALAREHLLYCALIGGACPPAPQLEAGQFDLYTNLLTVPIAMAAVLGAIFEHRAEKENLVANARRYDRMFRVFDRARRALLGIEHGKPGDPKRILYELGRASLVEHADWLIARRDRPLRVVVV